MTLFRAEYQPDLKKQSDDWVLVIVGRQVLLELSSGQPLIRRSALPGLGDPDLQLHLGFWKGNPCFLYLLADCEGFDDQRYRVTGLRAQLGLIEEEVFFLSGRALQLAHWYRRHRYCGQCGSATRLHDSEFAYVCMACEEYYYPVIAPCVMGLVIKGQTCLLAHNTRFPAGFYSVVAGFVEAGESAETAVLREVREETGITAGDPVYVASQPWPFPSQLMLGYVLTYKEGEICVDGKEIDHAQWFERNELPLRPPVESLSGKLIELFQKGHMVE